MGPIYLDNNATTRTDPAVVAAMLPFFTEQFGNASSKHAFEHLEGEAIVHHLDRAGVAASLGSACSSGSMEPSHVLVAMDVRATALRGAIRFSLSRQTTVEEIDHVARLLGEIVANQRGLSLAAEGGKVSQSRSTELIL